MTSSECPSTYGEERLRRLDDDVRQMLVREARRNEQIDEMDRKFTEVLERVSSICGAMERERGRREGAVWLARVLWAAAIALAGFFGFKIGGGHA